MDLAGRKALVTGGGRGIGAEIARRLAKAGADVAVSARTREEIEAVADQLRGDGHEAAAIAADVADPGQLRALVAAATQRFGQIDILVNNAGVADAAPLPKIGLEDWNRMLAVNATGVFLLTQALLPPMAERGWGRVINVASVAGRQGAPYIAAYCASKHAVVGFTRAIAVEYAARGVTVNAVCPGYVDSPMTEETIRKISQRTGRSPDEAREILEGRSPQRRLFRPEEVAHLVVTLCAEEAGGVTGQAIVLDGGAVQA